MDCHFIDGGWEEEERGVCRVLVGVRKRCWQWTMVGVGMEKRGGQERVGWWSRRGWIVLQVVRWKKKKRDAICFLGGVDGGWW